MRSASIPCSAIAARTAAQRRSSSAVEMGWLMRSDASAIDPPAQSGANLMQFPLLVEEGCPAEGGGLWGARTNPPRRFAPPLLLQGRDARLPFHHFGHALQVPGEPLAQVM